MFPSSVVDAVMTVVVLVASVVDRLNIDLCLSIMGFAS